jgi:hypothetical protein
MKTKKRDEKYIDDFVVEDGDPPVRVPVMVCDSLAGHRPGYWVRPLTDKQVAERQAAFDARRRKPDPDDDPDDDDDDASLEDVRAPAIRARHEYVQRLQDAWRTLPATHPATPSPNRTRGPRAGLGGPSVSDPANQFRDGTPEDAQAKRDQVWTEWSAALSEQWKNPGAASPNAAPTIERERERMTAEAK